MPSKTENLGLDIYSREERVKDWMDGSDQNFQVIDNTVGKVLLEIERNSTALSNSIELNEPYGTRIELYDTLQFNPNNDGTSGCIKDNYIYAFIKNGNLYKYNIKNKTYTSLEINFEDTILESLPSYLYNTNKIVWNNKIYLFTKDVEGIPIYEYDIENNKFSSSSISFGHNETLRHNPTVLSGHDIYVFGLDNGSYKIDLITKNTSAISGNGVYNYSLGISDKNNANIYLIGGLNNVGNTKKIYKYNISHDTYTFISEFNEYGVGGSVIKDKIYFFGGIENNACLNTVYCLDTTNDTLSLMEINLPSNVAFLDGMYNKGDIYLIGGKINYNTEFESDNLSLYRFVEF